MITDATLLEDPVFVPAPCVLASASALIGVGVSMSVLMLAGCRTWR